MWHERVVRELCEMKTTGVPFETAWRLALERHPPMSRDMGPACPCLFDEETSVVEFVRVAAEDAWHGRRPVLRHLKQALEGETLERVARRMRG